jgi:AcrR family transcriptional regulator
MQPPLDLQMKKKPMQARARATVTSILDATARILEREGYEATTTNRIAEVAGISIGSLYEYFPNKQAIVAHTLARTIEEIVLEVSSGLRTALALPNQPHDGIDYWMRGMTSALEKRSGLLRVAAEVPFLFQIPAVRALGDTLQHMATEGQKKSTRVVHFNDPESSTWLLMSMVWTAVLRTVLYRPAHLSHQRLLDTLIEMVIKLL